ncbi:MAG: hypothetical protein AB1505_27855 [Candidatus Latescibacterota bacterium]
MLSRDAHCRLTRCLRLLALLAAVVENNAIRTRETPRGTSFSPLTAVTMGPVPVAWGPDGKPAPLPGGRRHFVVGGLAILGNGFKTQIATPDVSDRQVVYGPASFLDASGQVLRSITPAGAPHVTGLATGPPAAGGHRATGEGQDDGRAPAGAGVYLVRLQVGSRAEVQKAVLLH